MGVALLLCSIAALGLGLLTSAVVGNAAQATLALPMLCFPAVLFSGAILPVHLMAGAGAGHQRRDPVALGVRGPRSRPRRPRESSPTAARHSARRCSRPTATPARSSTGAYWLILIAVRCAFLVATWAVLARSMRRPVR